MLFSVHQAVLLQAKAYRILRADVTVMLKPFDISLPEWCTMNLIAENPMIRGTEIAHELGVEIPMVTLIIRELEQKKILKRSFNTMDKRSRNISLTPHGKTTVTLIATTFKKSLPIYFDGTTSEDMRAYVRVLQNIIAKH